MKHLKYLSLILCAAVSLAWFVNKIALFNGLEYSVDVFVNLQASRSVVAGEPFMYEYFSGGLKGVHNHFVLLLLGPFTLLWGASAFFAATSLLQATASMRWASSVEPDTFAKASSIIAAMLFGPLMFWSLDNP